MKVAVYGTLRYGFNNHKLLMKSNFLGKTKTEPIFTMYGNFIPWVSNGGSTAITVEVYEIDTETFKQLDWLEGYPNYYDRRLINTEFGEAWIYFIDHRKNYENVIESGDWVEHTQKRDRLEIQNG